MTIIDMAKAHLQNVNNKIKELQDNKNLLDNEIDKLNKYVHDGLAIIKKEEDRLLNSVDDFK